MEMVGRAGRSLATNRGRSSSHKLTGSLFDPLPMPSYQYPRAALTVDCVVFGFDAGELKVLLIQRALEPFKGAWALPGGFVRVEETLDDAARRELVEETGLKDVFLEQLYTYGEIKRDPRERV